MLGLAACLLWTTSALAQINQNDGPLVPPIQPEPTVGLPEQAPVESTPPDLPEPEPSVSAPAADPRPAARQETPEAAASSSAWQLECLERDPDGRVCQAVLRARVGEQVALVLALARDPADGSVRLQMALPLGIDVQRGATLTVGDFSETLMLSRCTAQGCLVESAASDDLIEALGTGDAGSVQVYNTDGQPIDLPMPLLEASSVLSEAALN